MQRDDTSEEVKTLQGELARLGYLTGEPDGHFGLMTQEAVLAFQADNALTVDGIVGPRTMGTFQKARPVPLAKRGTLSLSKVPYFSQRDNKFQPSGTCNVTSLAMVMTYRGWKPSTNQQPEDFLFEKLNTPEARSYFEKNFAWAKKQGYNARNVHGMLTWLAKSQGLSASLSLERFDTIKSSLRTDVPLITTGLFTGSGHIVVLCGLTNRGDYIVNDPWGDWTTGYSNKSGQYRIYQARDIESLLERQEKGKALVHRIE